MHDTPDDDNDRIEIDPDPTDKNPALPLDHRRNRPSDENADQRRLNEKAGDGAESVDNGH